MNFDLLSKQAGRQIVANNGPGTYGTEISYNLDIAMPFGDMANDALVSKFEETSDLHDGEGVYDNYARQTLKDNRVDAPAMESDEPRRNYNAAGIINSRYYGGRGLENTPNHSEMFLELTEWEPRGIVEEPDIGKIVEQAKGRLRFARFYPDADNSVPSGRWSELVAFEKSRIDTQKAIQPRLQVFSTSKDGRREGLRKFYKFKPHVNMVQEDMARFDGSKSFSDYIMDYSLNPQRHTTKISNEIIRNSRMYQQFTTDHEFQIARYGAEPMNGRIAQKVGAKVTDYDGERIDELADGGERRNEDSTCAFKAAGILMGAIVSAKSKAEGQQVGGESDQTQARKVAMAARDLGLVMREIRASGAFGVADMGLVTKTGAPTIAAPLADLQVLNHTLPANVLFDAIVAAKAVTEAKDVGLVMREIRRDGRGLGPEDVGKVLKGALPIDKGGAKGGKMKALNEVNGQSLSTVSYKNWGRPGERKGAKMGGVERFARESDASKTGAKGNYRGASTAHTQAAHVATDMGAFRDNEYKERLMRGPDDKHRVRRMVGRDGPENEMSQ